VLLRAGGDCIPKQLERATTEEALLRLLLLLRLPPKGIFLSLAAKRGGIISLSRKLKKTFFRENEFSLGAAQAEGFGDEERGKLSRGVEHAQTDALPKRVIYQAD